MTKGEFFNEEKFDTYIFFCPPIKKEEERKKSNEMFALEYKFFFFISLTSFFEINLTF